MIKRTLNLIMATIAILYISYQYYIKRTANDEVDQYDYRAEVSE
ncbi:hypothetical protein ACOW2U_001544 [Staphylococcus pseudintermedius]|nr:hypothetical protein [Staphylococcus pseudintermedius]